QRPRLRPRLQPRFGLARRNEMHGDVFLTLAAATHAGRSIEMDNLGSDAGRSWSAGQKLDRLAREAGFLNQLATGGFGRIVIPLVADQPGRPIDDARTDWMAKLLREDQLSVGGAGDYGYRLFRLLSFDELPAPSLQDEHVLPFEHYFRGHGSAVYKFMLSGGERAVGAKHLRWHSEHVSYSLIAVPPE